MADQTSKNTSTSVTSEPSEVLELLPTSLKLFQVKPDDVSESLLDRKISIVPADAGKSSWIPSSHLLDIPLTNHGIDLPEQFPRPGGENRNYSVGTIKSETSEDMLSAYPTRDADLKTQTPVPAEMHHRGIYWRSPIYMVAFLLFGILAAVSHHVFYASLDGHQVGNDREQQWNLRWGTSFAYITQVSLVCSGSYAFTQYLWKTLKKTKVSVKALDAAFEADQTIVSLFNVEVLWKMKVVAMLALIVWCLPLASLVTPATLFVLPNYQTTSTQSNVTSLDMYSNLEQTKQFTYTVNSTESGDALFLGPRTIVSRLSTATATQGQILPIKAPYLNSTYPVQFHGPAVQCQPPNSTVVAVIDYFRNQSVANFSLNPVENINYYFAFVPNLIDFQQGPPPPNGVQWEDQIRLQQPTNASNELWMVYSRYSYDSEGNRSVVDQYTSCQLYNASYNVQLTFLDGSQTFNTTTAQLLNRVDYPLDNEPESVDLMVQHAYSAVMWALTDLLVGSMGLFTEYSANNSITQFSEITTQIEHTSLLGSSDLDVFFDASHFLYSNSTESSGQRQMDINLAGNRTLDVLIPELAFNTTMSFLSNELMSPLTLTNVYVTNPVNIYAYHSKNLFISYGLAIFFAVFVNLLGADAYWTNGHSHAKTFSAILASTRDRGLTKLFRSEAEGRLPLHDEVRNAKLMFGGLPNGGLGFWRA